MVTTIARKRRPALDEPCPDWARHFFSQSWWQDQDRVGITYEHVPQQTSEALDELFPVPAPPKRLRKHEPPECHYKPYVRAWAAAVYFACLPFALARQCSLFANPQEKEAGDIAILCFQRLSDLAKRLGLSYDRLQKWMTVLLILGFVKRFRDGRRVLYILPLTAYVPSPSPEAVLKKLDELIESQFVEETLPGGRTVWRDRCPEWTVQLMKIRARFVLRYQLPPTVIEEQLFSPLVTTEKPLLPPASWEKRSSDQAFQAMLHEVSEAIPEATRSAVMRQLFPILARAYAEIVESTSGSRSLPDQQTGVAVRSGEAPRDSSFSSSLDSATIHREKARGALATESRCDAPDPDVTGAGADGQSRFDAARSSQENGPDSLQRGTSVPATKPVNLDSVAGESLTLRCNNFVNKKSYGENEDVNVRDAASQLRAENRRKAELLADLLGVPGNINFYTKLFNQVSRGELGEDLIKAVFIYTLHQERTGDIADREPDALGKYFYGVFKRWSLYRTYGAACRAYNGKKWHSKVPPGIKPRDKEAIDGFMQYDFAQIAEMIRRGVLAEETGWLPLTGEEGCSQGANRPDLEDVVEAQVQEPFWEDGERSAQAECARKGAEARQGILRYPSKCAPWTGATCLALLEYYAGGALSASLLAQVQREAEHLVERLARHEVEESVWYLLEQEPTAAYRVEWTDGSRTLRLREGLAEQLEQVHLAAQQTLLELGQYEPRITADEIEVDGELVSRERYLALRWRAYEEVYREQHGVYPWPIKDWVALEAAARQEETGTSVELPAMQEETAKRRAEVSLEELCEQPGLAVMPPGGRSSLLPGGLPFWWEELSLNLAESDGARLDMEAARQYRVRLQQALAPQLYRLLARPMSREGALCFAIELISLCSGWTLTLEKGEQVELLLNRLEVQPGAGEGACVSDLS